MFSTGMQMFKRASHNFALNFAIQMANERRLPLVVSRD
jgi:hypothetical protein